MYGSYNCGGLCCSAFGCLSKPIIPYDYLDFSIPKLILNYVIPSGLIEYCLMFFLPLQFKTCENVFQMYIVPPEEAMGCLHLKLVWSFPHILDVIRLPSPC